jgi:hypothetical protein
MRVLMNVALCALLGGCAASVPEVRARLGQEYIGKNVDTLVMRWGPPASTFKMNNGQTSYVWQIGTETQVQLTGGSGGSKNYTGSTQTFTCKVSVIASASGTVSQLDVQDSKAEQGVFGAETGLSSMCGEQLGMKRQG